MPNKNLTKLTAAMKDRSVVRFSRPFEAGTFLGYVLDIGHDFFLLRVIADNIRFDGFSCLRLADVRNLEAPHDYEKFVLQALKHRREKILRQPSINLTSIETILVSASKVFPLITIHREKINPDVCGIGKVLSIESDSVSMLDIGPDALWDGEPTSRMLRDITRVDFGGGYEEALNLVGGKPPMLGKSHK